MAFARQLSHEFFMLAIALSAVNFQFERLSLAVNQVEFVSAPQPFNLIE
jgi:hypothetical protein